MGIECWNGWNGMVMENTGVLWEYDEIEWDL